MKKTILVIEDNADIRENIAEILALADYSVNTASNGEEGVANARQNPPDLILSDIMMPGGDGFFVLRELQEDSSTAGIPFIFITARAERPDMRKGMELGADDYLTKPFDDVELLAAVEARFKKNAVQKEHFSKSLLMLTELVGQRHGLDELRATIEKLRTVNYKKKKYIYSEGDRINGFFLIISGKVKTLKLTEDGKDFLTGIYEKDDFLGVNMLFCDGSHNDSAIAMEDAELSFFPKQQFEELISKYPDIAGKFIKILSNEILAREEHLLTLAYRSVRQRIAEALLRYGKQFGLDNAISASRVELAAMSGTAPETVSRTLTDFASEGLLEKKGNLLFITSARGLERV
ncbi:MAG: response regulator [Flavobacterium sp.]|nr:MAG: response regulator [Flavobacterium sp.]